MPIDFYKELVWFIKSPFIKKVKFKTLLEHLDLTALNPGVGVQETIARIKKNYPGDTVVRFCRAPAFNAATYSWTFKFSDCTWSIIE